MRYYLKLRLVHFRERERLAAAQVSSLISLYDTLPSLEFHVARKAWDRTERDKKEQAKLQTDGGVGREKRGSGVEGGEETENHRRTLGEHRQTFEKSETNVIYSKKTHTQDNHTKHTITTKT